jgi:hypothetical protein
MNVIAFIPKASRSPSMWRADELNVIMEAVAPALDDGTAAGWDIGTTEIGDPQFYVLGPPPGEDCILCVSRLGRRYVLENGAGRVASEHERLSLLAGHVRTLLAKKKSRLVARLAVFWVGLRELFQEKLEPMVVEGEEMLTHLVPQLAALA